jgi:hypothetical protein
MNNILSFICMLLLYLGLAGVQGAIMRATTMQDRLLRALFFLLVILPFSLGLPWQPTIKLAIWMIAAVVIYVVYKQPLNPISRSWSEKFALGYFGSLMLFISAWAIVSQAPFSSLTIVLPAVLVSFICLVKLFQTKLV